VSEFECCRGFECLLDFACWDIILDPEESLRFGAFVCQSRFEISLDNTYQAFFFFSMDDCEKEKDNDEKMKANMGEQVAEASPIAVGSSRSVRKRIRPSFNRALLIVYKKVLSMIRQAFKMVADLEKLGRRDLPGEMIVKEMIENTRVWLIDQMGKNFPRAKGHFLLKRWKKLEPLFQSLVCGGRKSVVALSPPRADVPAAVFFSETGPSV